MSEEPQHYWAEIMPLVGEVPVEKIVGKILHDLPDLQNRANLAAWFAFNVKAGLRSAEALEAHGSDKAPMVRQKMMVLLDVIFLMLGGPRSTT